MQNDKPLYTYDLRDRYIARVSAPASEQDREDDK